MWLRMWTRTGWGGQYGKGVREESEEGKEGRVVARERSLNHSLPGPRRDHKVPLVSPSSSAGLQVAGGGGDGNSWRTRRALGLSSGGRLVLWCLFVLP